MTKQGRIYGKNKYIYSLCLLFLLVVLATGCASSRQKDSNVSKNVESTESISSKTSDKPAAKTEETLEEGNTLPGLIPLEDFTPEQSKLHKKLMETMETYPEAYAYIDIPDTPVSEPMVQSRRGGDYNYYYLDHCIDGTPGFPGTIFTCHVNAKDFTDFNTVIYGHNMNNGSMFGSLKKYSDAAYRQEHELIYIYTTEGMYVYRVFAAVIYDDRLITQEFPEEKADSPQKFLESLQKVRNFNSWVSEDIQVTEEDHIITLSTCIANSPEERFLVCALLEE